MARRRTILILASLAALPCGGGAAGAENGSIKHSFKGHVTAESRLFIRDPLSPGQRPQHLGGSIAGEVEYVAELPDRNRITLKPFFRYDASDNRRTHWDVREAMWLKVWKGVELRVGAGKVFWGVTESSHLVDVVNQTDLVENVDGEDKLGQPMVYLSFARKWGTIDLLYLPYFRERTFPGRGGRLRSRFYVETSRARYQDGLKEWHPDIAVRYSHAVGKVDVGVYYFRGTARDPTFSLGLNESGEPVLIPFYQVVDQVGLDAQLTTGPWLLKAEVLLRLGQNNRFGTEEDYVSWSAGFEYTFYSVFGTRADIGVLAEHHFDNRGRRATTPFQNDLFVGARLAFNDPQDSQILIGVIQDLGSRARSYFIEASRRIGSRWTVSIEGRFQTDAERKDILFDLRRDNFVQVEVTFNF